MLIAYMQKVYPDYITSMPPLKDLQSFYKASKNEFDKDPDFKKISQSTVVRLQSGDPDCIKAWQIICDISRQEFLKIYKRLHIKLEEFGESFYNSRIPGVIKECEEKGIVQMSEGAKCIFVQGFTVREII
jgi:arginyl-tRNA synthetase